MTRVSAAVLASVLGLADLAASSGESLKPVLLRAGDYVVNYGRALATVVAEERYEQRLVGGESETLQQRTLVSEIAFVHLADSQEWLTFRNVVKVDDRAVDGAEGRLDRILRGAPPTIVGQARALATASARHNIGPLHRDFNAPAMPLQFLYPSRQPDIRFDKRGEEVIGGERIWVVRFRESDRVTLIRRIDGRGVPATGLLWIAPADGRVLRASFVVDDFVPRQPKERKSRGSLDVTWRPEPKLDLWVPGELRERYEGPWADQGLAYDIVGTATYSNYRRFDVDVRLIDRR
jgi:hypothetical protein